jgi:hypothetical protein
MNDRDKGNFDPRIADWLEGDPNEAPDQVLQIVLAAFPSIRQRHGWPLPWRAPNMNGMTRVALAAMAVVAIAVGGLFFVYRPTGGVGGAPTPSTLPSPSAADPFNTASWVAFTSTRYGYSISHPGTWSAQPSDHDWSLATDRTDWLSTAADAFRASDNSVLFTVFAAPIPAGVSSDEWIASYLSPSPSSSSRPSGTPGASASPETCFQTPRPASAP